MKVLIIGRGGREHALAWKISQSKQVQTVYVAPGNDGMRDVAKLENLEETDFDGIIQFVKKEGIDYTIVGPEIPLSKGIVDVFKKEGLKIFGPTASAARIESSKIFAKELMKKYHIPTADFFVAKNKQEAIDFLQSRPEGPVVIKADGLAAGKGVVICENKEIALQNIHEYMDEKKFGTAGERVVIEEKLTGEEVSVFVLTDGENYVILPPSQDHKRVFDDDQGPNTGGMGAYAPTPMLEEKDIKVIEKEIIQPVLQGMNDEGAPFQGCLYCGLMITKDGPKVIEFNCRFGDPETQVVLPIIESDLFNLIKEISDGQLKTTQIQFKKKSAVAVVLASGGYPGSYEKGKVINGLNNPDLNKNYILFHAGTRKNGDLFVTNGGRVLNVVAIDNSIPQAIERVYEGVNKISFEGMHYRKDIGKKGLKYIRRNK